MFVGQVGLEPTVPEGNGFTDRAATNYRLLTQYKIFNCSMESFNHLAVLTGFEPVISCVTGRHPLHWTAGRFVEG